MKSLSVILLAVWLMLFGAIQATWISMAAHSFGVLTFIVGLAILILEFYLWRTTPRA
jgi:hypothetical protein